MPTPEEQKKAHTLFSQGLKHMNGGGWPRLDQEPKGKGWIRGGNDFRMWIQPEKLLEACRCFREAHAIAPDAVALNQLALTLESLGKYEEAIEVFREMEALAGQRDNKAYVNAAVNGIKRLGKKAGKKAWVVTLPQAAAPEAAKAEPADHEKVAHDFAKALVEKRFKDAHELLAADAKKKLAAAQLEKHYRKMTGYFESPAASVDIINVMDDWPDRRKGDLAWVYVAITGEGESEAVTVVVREEGGKALIRSIEWGRP